MATETELEPNVFVVSGGSKGLGQRLVERLLDAGHVVATFSRGSTPFIERTQISDPECHRFCWRAVNGSDRAELVAFLAEVLHRYGRIDGLVNNAGIGLDGLLTLTQPASIARTISLNLEGTIALTQLCTKQMLRQRSGCIVNISSVNSVRGHSGVSVYSATKAALDGFTRSLARELGPSRIRVNSVAPGYFQSDMVADMSEAQRLRISRRTPLGRLATANDVADGVLFLCSNAAQFVTGQTLVIDGGLTC